MGNEQSIQLLEEMKIEGTFPSDNLPSLYQRPGKCVCTQPQQFQEFSPQRNNQKCLQRFTYVSFSYSNLI